jgi:hypothetical protein
MPRRSDIMQNTNLTLRAHFSAKNTHNIVKNVSARNTDWLLTDASASVEETFSDASATEELCSSPEVAAEGVMTDASACMELVSSKTERGVEKMIKAGQKLAWALKKGTEKQATKAFAAFGEAMLTNRYTFQAGLKLAGDNLKVDYVVEGSDFAAATTTMKTSGNSGKLVRDSRKPLFQREVGTGLMNDATFVAY